MGASSHRFGRRVFLLVVHRVDVLLTVVLRCEMLDHFVRACAVEIVHSARCLPVGTFKSRCTYSYRTITSSSPCRPPGVSEGFRCKRQQAAIHSCTCERERLCLNVTKIRYTACVSNCSGHVLLLRRPLTEYRVVMFYSLIRGCVLSRGIVLYRAVLLHGDGREGKGLQTFDWTFGERVLGILGQVWDSNRYICFGQRVCEDVKFIHLSLYDRML